MESMMLFRNQLYYIYECLNEMLTYMIWDSFWVFLPFFYKIDFRDHSIAKSSRLDSENNILVIRHSVSILICRSIPIKKWYSLQPLSPHHALKQRVRHSCQSPSYYSSYHWWGWTTFFLILTNSILFLNKCNLQIHSATHP